MAAERKHLVLWLDDEQYYLENHIAELRSDPRIELVYLTRVEEALERLADPQFVPDLLIWDMILPPGPFTLEETDDGLQTGARFFDRFRKIHPKTPALLFTNVTLPQIVGRFDDSPGNSWVRTKTLNRKELHREVGSRLRLDGEKP